MNRGKREDRKERRRRPKNKKGRHVWAVWEKKRPIVRCRTQIPDKKKIKKTRNIGNKLAHMAWGKTTFSLNGGEKKKEPKDKAADKIKKPRGNQTQLGKISKPSISANKECPRLMREGRENTEWRLQETSKLKKKKRERKENKGLGDTTSENKAGAGESKNPSL